MSQETNNQQIIKMEGKNNIPVEVAMIYNSSFSENLHSYVNNINTHEGGTHLLVLEEVSLILKKR